MKTVKKIIGTSRKSSQVTYRLCPPGWSSNKTFCATDLECKAMVVTLKKSIQKLTLTLIPKSD